MRVEGGRPPLCASSDPVNRACSVENHDDDDALALLPGLPAWLPLSLAHCQHAYLSSLVTARKWEDTSCPGSMAQPIEQWLLDIPPVTRAWVIAAVGMSVMVVSQDMRARKHSSLPPGMPTHRSCSALLLVEGGCGQHAGWHTVISLVSQADKLTAVALRNDVLLLWPPVSGPCLSSLLHVSYPEA